MVGGRARAFPRVPPPAGDDDAVGKYAFVARHVLAGHVDIVELTALDRQDGGVADASDLQVPSSGRFKAIAAFTVVAAMTSLSRIPMHRNFDNVVTWSKAGR